MSLGRRLSLLVVSELLIAVFCGTMALATLHQISEESRYMRGYVFAPLVALGDAIEAGVRATTLAESAVPGAPAQAQEEIGRVRVFFERYRREWLVVGSSVPEAKRFRESLRSVDKTELLASEREAVDALDGALQRLDRPRLDDIITMRAAVAKLNNVNIRFMEAAYEAYQAKQTALVNLFLVIGAMGALLAPLLGLAVHRAIVPRVQRLVKQIERFREFGLHEPIEDHGGDELAVLARTLDVGFAAIATRDEERKRFLSVAAHELKTPLTTIKGFAQVALDHRDDPKLRDRALAVIDRQATRLARLVQDLLWVASAQAGRLAFKPSPVDVADVAQKALGEVSLVSKNRRFALTPRGDVHVLGDPTLLEHALFSLLVEAASMSSSDAPLPVVITGSAGNVRFAVEVPDAASVPDDLHRLTEPFTAIQFEGVSEIRSTGLGPHVVHEIAKLHGAGLQIEPRAGGGVVFALDLQR